MESFSVKIVTANVNFPGYSYLRLVENMLNSKGQWRRKWLGCCFLGRRVALGEKLKRDVKDDIHLQYTNWNERALQICSLFKNCDADFYLIQETNMQMIKDMGFSEESCVYAPYILDIGDKKLESKLERGTAVVSSTKWKRVDMIELGYELTKTGKKQIRKGACGLFYNDFLQVRILVLSLQLAGYNPHSHDASEYCFGDNELIFYLNEIEKIRKERNCVMAVIGGDFNQDLKGGDQADNSNIKRRSQILNDFGYNFYESFASTPTVDSKRCLDYIAFKHFLKLDKSIKDDQITTGIKTELLSEHSALSDHRFVLSSIELGQRNGFELE